MWLFSKSWMGFVVCVCFLSVIFSRCATTFQKCWSSRSPHSFSLFTYWQPWRWKSQLGRALTRFPATCGRMLSGLDSVVFTANVSTFSVQTMEWTLSFSRISIPLYTYYVARPVRLLWYGARDGKVWDTSASCRELHKRKRKWKKEGEPKRTVQRLVLWDQPMWPCVRVRSGVETGTT